MVLCKIGLYCQGEVSNHCCPPHQSGTPAGSWLLFWPCGWGLAQAAPPGCLPDPALLAIYAAGAFIMRGAGCTINDMWDRDIDSKVRIRVISSRNFSSPSVTTFRGNDI